MGSGTVGVRDEWLCPATSPLPYGEPSSMIATSFPTPVSVIRVFESSSHRKSETPRAPTQSVSRSVVTHVPTTDTGHTHSRNTHKGHWA